MSGLLNRKTSRSLPLRSSSIFTEIKGFTARTTAVLTYYNDHRREIEGLFVLPLDQASAIVEFESIIEGHYIFADVMHISELSEKTTKFEGEQMCDGVFNVSIGKIPPWILVEIQVTVICEIGVLFYGDALRYILPQTFSPKVVSKEENLDKKACVATSTLAYSFQLEILIEAPCLLCGVQSNTHPIQVDAPPLSETGSKLRVSLPDEYEPTSNVFELLMFLCRPREPYILIEEAKEPRNETGHHKNPISNIMNNPILMLSYSPDISNFTEELKEYSTNQIGEFILMIELSTTFETKIMHEIKEGCSLFLKTLPTNCCFNVVNIGASCDHLFSSSQQYSRENLDRALNYVNNLTISQEEPSSLKALKWLYYQELLHLTPRQVFIITSSNREISNEEIELVRKKHHMARIFVFTLGTSTNTNRSLEAVCSTTKGKCYVTGEGERLQKQMMSCLKAALQPAITNLKVSWILPDAYDVIYTPENLPSLFLGDRLNLYAILASKETERTEKQTDSISSVKEFWFEDFELFDEFVEKQCSSHDLLTDVATETTTPDQYIDSKEDIEVSNSSMLKQLENDNEVFLTDEEATQLKNNIGFQKRTSIERIQTWRVSKYPENDIDLDLNDDLNYSSDTERVYLQRYRRKKSSSDGAESIGSTNSHSSNMSSSSHFLAFPGYPTRLSSCRSIETRSPHFPKQNEEAAFTFSEPIRDRHLSNERLYSTDNKNEKNKKQERVRKRLTQALIDEHVNTHLIDLSNEDVIEQLLESIVTEKRHHLNAYVKVQAEMTQCTWPSFDHDRKNKSDKADWRDSRIENRDSGFGHRSSSEPRTSDLEEEQQATLKKSGQFSKSSSGYFEQDNDTVIDQQYVEKTNESNLNQKENIKKETRSKSQQLRTASSLSIEKAPKLVLVKKTVSDSKVHHHKKKFKPKQMWNAILDRVKTITNVVSDRSGEANFKIHNDIKIPDSFEKFPETVDKEDAAEEVQISKDDHVQEKVLLNKEDSKSDVSLSTIEPKKNTSAKKEHKYRQRYIRNRPLIENSRTISTSSMFEIGQSEIGDVDHLHLLPSHALIYLSGQFGQRAFKRIIPFQLVFSEEKESSPSNITVHQLAAKSIIRDLEIQMDQDEMLMLNSGRAYVKNLIGDVSKESHVLSKYTTVVTIDDKTSDSEIISSLKFNDPQENENLKLSYQPFSINGEQKKMIEKKSKAEKQALYHEVKSDRENSGSTIYRTKLTLKSPTYDRAKSPIGSHKSNNKTTYTKSSLYMKAVDLMTYDGFWELSYLFAEALTINYSRLRESCPFADPLIKNKSYPYLANSLTYQDTYEHIWATTIALAWLHSHCLHLHDEWFLIHTKAKQWLRKQKLPKGFTIDDMFLLSQQTLKILKSTSRRGSAT